MLKSYRKKPREYSYNFNDVSPNGIDIEHKTFKYLDENDFIRKARSLRKYCPKAYKELVFGTRNKNLNLLPNGRYTQNLYTSDEFKTVYGQIKLAYSVENGNVTIEDIEPSQFLLDGYVFELDIYKGMPFRNDRDKFKIDLMITKKENYGKLL